jgi:ribosomal protein S18 acetylase RimI-like enzyme
VSVVLRAGRPEDAGAAGDMLWSFQQGHDWMPEVHSRAECRDFCGRMIARGWVIVAAQGGETLGFLARDETEICAFYVADGAQGRGIGKRLLAAAKLARDRLWLRCFQANLRARGFYEAADFVETARSAGQANDENLPDITYVWEKKVAR